MEQTSDTDKLDHKSRPGRLKRFVRDLFFLGIAFAAIQWWQLREHPQVMTDAQIQGLDGGTAALLPEQGVRLIYAFAPWCSVCEWTGANVAAATGVVDVVALALDYRSIDSVRKAVHDHNVEVPVWLGDDELVDKLGIGAYPSFFWVNDKGAVLAGSVGFTSRLGLLLRSYWARGKNN